MIILKAKQGNGDLVSFRCPTVAFLKSGGLTTKSKGWKSTDMGCSTILFENDYCLTITSSLWGKGAEVVLVASCVAETRCKVVTFKLKHDDLEKNIPDLNAKIGNCFKQFLKPYGWR